MESRIEGLERTADRHEALIEAMRTQLVAIHESLVRIETTLSNSAGPGKSDFCITHMKVLNDFEKRLTEMSHEIDAIWNRISTWGGGIAAVVAMLTLFGPWIRELFHLNIK